MSEQFVAKQLRALIERYGTSLCSEPKRLEALLRDYCPQNRREVHILLTAVQAQIPDELLASKTPPQLLLGQLIARLQDDMAMADAAAHWAVSAWARALRPDIEVIAFHPTNAPAPPIPAPDPMPEAIEPPIEERPKDKEAPPLPVSAASPSAAPASTVSGPPRDTPSVKPPQKYGIEWVEIPAGEFTMGSNNLEYARPAHQVYLDGYFISKNVVTVKQYLIFCRATATMQPEAPYFNRHWEKEGHPIVNVSWSHAMVFCSWLSGEIGLVVSLPTEAEWEKAARGTDARKYPWGNLFNRTTLRCSGLWLSAAGTSLVGSYPSGASPYGVLDMAGNVCEWCADWYGADYYQNSSERNPTGPANGDGRVLRGGSWFDAIDSNFECARRNASLPDNKSNIIGFRCVVRSAP
jgi:formylglycine-generating enzyme required for sulfatase activity